MSAPFQELVGRKLGDYQIEREIGRGGMGVVYAAQQISLNRPVALKVLSAHLGLTSQNLSRFRREAEAAARLHHTNIVPVYGIGEEDGVAFYAMERITGPSLDRVVEQLRKGSSTVEGPNETLPSDLAATGPYVPAPSSGEAADSSSLGAGPRYFDTVARMIAEVADALDHAHRQGVIHRDIKPSNLLLSSEGRLSVNDFGLARVLEQPGLTQTGDMLGTPAYMSPEQITAGRIPLDHRTDIYSLGATLYELLTLQRPFRGAGRDQVLAQIMHKDPISPRRINKAVPLDLETICLKCLEKDPDRRYANGQALGEDLRRFVNRHAILARRVGMVERFVKWCRRHPALAASLAGLMIAVGVAGFFAYRAHQADVARKEADRRGKEDQERLQDEIRITKRKTALDWALLHSMAANFPAAEAALDEAIAHGVSPGEALLLQGQIDLHRGQADKAIEQLEKAATLLPENIAAQAILRGAYREVGQFDRYYVGIKAVYKMEPKTPEDFLFVGQVLGGHYEPRKALPLLNRAVEMRNSPIARVIRTEVLALTVTDSATPEEVEQLLREAHGVMILLPKNPVAAAVNLQAQLAGACFYERTGDLEKKALCLKSAAAEVQNLGAFPPFQRGTRARLNYFELTEDDDAILAEYRRVKDTPSGRLAARSAFHALFRNRDYNGALSILKAHPAAGDETMHLIRYACADAHLPGGPARAGEMFRKHREARKGKGVDARLDYYPTIIPLLLGHGEQVQDLARTWVEKTEHREVQYLGGKVSEKDLLARSGASRWHLCERHFIIAMKSLAFGDREKAREHFEKAVQTRIQWFVEYELSRVFLAHLAHDPEWPRWIPPAR